MTFCLGMRVKDGLVGIADTRVTSGSEYITARKLSTYEVDGGSFFVMTSGLRSVRDKALTYFGVHMSELAQPYTRLYEVVNAFAAQVRRASHEDREALESNGTKFSINVLLGGKLSEDAGHHLYQIYPEANWVEIGPGTPYHIIGARGYGKPILDRTLNFEDSLRFALKVGCLAFDSTRISAADVGFPIDVVIMNQTTGGMRVVEHRYEQADFLELSARWQEQLREALETMAPDWIDKIFSKLPNDCEDEAD